MIEEGRPRCFVSYSHADREHAVRLANKLRTMGIDVWIDALQILPGDSIVQKIFEEGLKDCRVFVVLLSARSTQSEWVKHELDVALVNRIRKVTRVVPVVVEECEIPVSLRALRWVDLRNGQDEAAAEIALAAFGGTRIAVAAEVPAFAEDAASPRAGLSPEATAVGAFIASRVETERYPDEWIEGSEITRNTGLSESIVNDAVDELESGGMVRVRRFMGTHPFEFGAVEPTYALVYAFPDRVQGEIQPATDTREVAALVASLGQVDGKEICERLGFAPNRVNFAVEYLRDYGLVKTVDYMGTMPFSFGHVMAIRNTRQFTR